MDNNDIKRISDPNQLKQLTERLFLKLPVQLQDRTGVHEVRVESYEEGVLILSHNEPDAPSRLVVLNHGQNRMFLECNVEGRSPGGNEKVRPVRLHLKKQERREARLKITDQNNRVAWITSAIPMKSIPEFLSSYNEKRDMMLNAYQEQLRQTYEFGEIVFRKTFRMDMRMRTMTNSNKPIFVPSRMNPGTIDPASFVSYEEFKKIIQYDQLPDAIVSEITEPLTYKKIYMFGYMKAQSEREMTDEDYKTVNQMSRDFENEILNQDFLPTGNDRSVVVDITRQGVGFMHPHNPSAIRNFMPGEHMVFDIHYPSGKVITMSGIIRNMKSLEKAHRIGVEFDTVKPDQMEALEQYIESLPQGGASGSASPRSSDGEAPGSSPAGN